MAWLAISSATISTLPGSSATISSSRSFNQHKRQSLSAAFPFYSSQYCRMTHSHLGIPRTPIPPCPPPIRRTGRLA